jgi:hypothetical protein
VDFILKACAIPLPRPDLPEVLGAAPALAWLGPRDFARARAWAPALWRWESYDDFVAERDGLFIGLGAGGVHARFRRVDFGEFEKWMRLTGAPATLDALDEFAAHCAFRADFPDAPVIGRIGVPGDPGRSAASAAGEQCVRVQALVFRRWRDEFARLALFAASDLDSYATHVVECCMSAPRRMRRPAVSSS